MNENINIADLPTTTCFGEDFKKIGPPVTGQGCCPPKNPFEFPRPSTPSTPKESLKSRLQALDDTIATLQALKLPNGGSVWDLVLNEARNAETIRSQKKAIDNLLKDQEYYVRLVGKIEKENQDLQKELKVVKAVQAMPFAAPLTPTGEEMQKTIDRLREERNAYRKRANTLENGLRDDVADILLDVADMVTELSNKVAFGELTPPSLAELEDTEFDTV